MRDESDSLARRIVTTFLIVFVVLLLVSLVGFCSGRWEDADAEPLSSSRYDAELIALDRIALTDAYRGRAVRLFETWLSPTTQGSAGFVTGMQRARRGYIEAMTEIEKREAASPQPK